MAYWVIVNKNTGLLHDLVVKNNADAAKDVELYMVDNGSLKGSYEAVEHQGDILSETKFRRDYRVKNGIITEKVHTEENEDFKVVDGKHVERTGAEKVSHIATLKQSEVDARQSVQDARDAIAGIDVNNITLKQIAQMLKDRG